MELIQTKSFSLATYSKGNPGAPKFALVLPGKLDTKDYAHMRSHVDFLASKGFYAISFDPAGTWESPGDLTLYSVTNYLKAIDELIEYYGNKPTFVMGHSRGASMALMTGSTNPQIIAFAAIMPSLSKEGFLVKKDDEWKEKGYKVSMRDLPPGGGPEVKKFDLPYSFLEDELKYHLTEEYTKSTKPKLFILGKKDPLVLPHIVRETFDSFAKPKELYELDSDHDYRLHENLINEVNSIVGAFLEKYNL